MMQYVRVFGPKDIIGGEISEDFQMCACIVRNDV
jgi:hypothetical protein